jgi:mannose-6-phosphate isomerase
MSQTSLYPLRFEPIYQYRLWGGRRLADLLTAPLPGDGPIGEAWVLSDREDHPSRVANGPLKGSTIAQLMAEHPVEMLGGLIQRFHRFPLLLKFLDAREMLSVQVHPSDTHRDLLPKGESGKTEAWVVLEAETESRIYAGLKPKTTAEELRRALANGTVADDLAYFTPKPGDGVFLPAGTVHTLGGGVVVFEIQQNSDVTFRLYDWGQVADGAIALLPDGFLVTQLWRATFITTERAPSKYSSTFRRTSSESASSNALMSPIRTGNSAPLTFTRGNTGSNTWRHTKPA